MDDGEGLVGRTAVVTGGSSGLGRATAMALAAAGAEVAVLARGSADLEETAEQIRSAGGTVSPVVVDLADAHQIASAIEQVHRDLGGVDVLVNAAGTVTPLHEQGWP